MTEFKNETLTYDHSNTSKVLFWFFLSLETLLICVGNTVICWLLCFRKKLRTKQNMFVLSLSVSDLFVGISVPPCEYCAFKVAYPNNCAYICGSVISFNILASAVNLTLIATDRYFSIVMPFAYEKRVTWKRAIMIIILAWLLALLLTLIPFIWMFDGKMLSAQKIRTNIIFSITVFSCIILNGWLIGSMYYRIVKIVQWQLQKRINNKRRNTAGIKVCIMVAISYFICWIPTAVIEVLYQYIVYIPLEVSSIAYFLLLLNPCLDPLMYGYYRKDFRKEICRLFGCKKSNNHSKSLTSQSYFHLTMQKSLPAPSFKKCFREEYKEIIR
ncbi:D(1C) dopamine receptor-like [Hydra vulgaris]|uniref:D(1C) dopamine receptor-like n=1 Tax=Hydra vulgaris TaxID=6087 RepID=A0ABM4DFZ3_HYDVU